VRLAYADDRLGIMVTNDSSGPPPATGASGPGYGLIGMRERVLSVGGRLRVGRRLGGGFEVSTELPLRPRRADQGQNP
jgi:signal transduction histidine kinase